MKRLLFFSLLCLVVVGTRAQTSQTPTPQWRPTYHFTPLKYWTNDPNGLIYVNGVFNLYNQQNPYENKWGHMSWGHATSTDLVHWTHLPIAMYESIQGGDTIWRFSGCAVMDRHNTSGFCKGDSCIVAIYTAHQPDLHRESQFVAYSNDHGMHFTNYDHNPVIDLKMQQFRDPNVRWNSELGKWLMVVAMPLEHQVRFYASANLKNWDLLSAFGPAGIESPGVWECPSFFELPVQGEPGVHKWVLMASFGSRGKTRMQYFVGDFDGKNFINDNPADTTLLVDYGNSFYAAIPWNHLPKGQNIYIGWMVPPPQETSPWRGQMSIPRDLVLRKTAYGIRLFQQPASLIEKALPQLSGHHFATKTGISLEGSREGMVPESITNGNSYWIEASLSAGPGVVAGFNLAEKWDSHHNLVQWTQISYDPSRRVIIVDRSHSGTARLREGDSILTMPLPPFSGPLDLKILADKSSLEVFADHGARVLTTYFYPEKGATGFSAFSKGGKAWIHKITIWDMSKVHN